MVTTGFKQGDIILMDFAPQAGHEQAGKRPALVISNELLNLNTNMTMVIPITSTMKRHPLHVELGKTTKTQGMILCEHAKSLDLNARNAKFLENAPAVIVGDVLNILLGYLESV